MSLVEFSLGMFPDEASPPITPMMFPQTAQLLNGTVPEFAMSEHPQADVLDAVPGDEVRRDHTTGWGAGRGWAE